MAHIAIGQDSLLNLYSNVEVTAGLSLVFSSEAAKYNYMMKRVVKQYSAMSYIYRNGRVKIQDTPQVVAKANYISFNNPSFEAKPIYARIVDYNYINNATVEIAYEVDYWLTFMFDVKFRSCQIMREHLSQSDYTKAVANPWRHDIRELNTAEQFAVDEEDYMAVDFSTPTDVKRFPDISLSRCNQDMMVCINMTLPDLTSKEASDSKTPLGRWAANYVNMPGAFTPTGSRFKLQMVAGAIKDLALPAATILACFSTSNGMSDFAGFVELTTAAGITSNIVSVFAIPRPYLYIFGTQTNQRYDTAETFAAGVCSQADDPKMKRYPFSMIEAISPDGSRMEYKYEDFLNLREGGAGASFGFGVVSIVEGIPYVALVPKNYKYKVSSGSANQGFAYNMEEATEFANIPQVAYSVDSFLTYMSQQYASSIQNTQNPTQLIKRLASIIPSATSGAMQGALAGGPIGAVGGGIANAASAALGSGLLDDILVQGYMKGSMPLYDYSAEKAAHASRDYKAGTLSGLPYMLGRVFFEVRFKRVDEAKANLAVDYFKAFGYNSGRIGVPRVCNIVTGSGALPHFETWDGDPCTYVQTADMHVISNMKPCSDYIEALFDRGCRFINGDGR